MRQLHQVARVTLAATLLFSMAGVASAQSPGRLAPPPRPWPAPTGPLTSDGPSRPRSQIDGDACRRLRRLQPVHGARHEHGPGPHLRRHREHHDGLPGTADDRSSSSTSPRSGTVADYTIAGQTLTLLDAQRHRGPGVRGGSCRDPRRGLGRDRLQQRQERRRDTARRRRAHGRLRARRHGLRQRRLQQLPRRLQLHRGHHRHRTPDVHDDGLRRRRRTRSSSSTSRRSRTPPCGRSRTARSSCATTAARSRSRSHDRSCAAVGRGPRAEGRSTDRAGGVIGAQHVP